MALGARLRFSAPSIAYGARYSVGARLRISVPSIALTLQRPFYSPWGSLTHQRPFYSPWGLAYASAPLL